MLNYIWAGLIFVSIICGAITGRMPMVAAAAVSGAADAVQLVLSIGGMIILWSGLMEIGEKAGLVAVFAKAIAPLLRLLFPDAYDDKACRNAIAMNMAANFLGLGNAATPLGIKAVGELKRLSGGKSRATRSMAMFVVVNTASIQFLPTTVAALRAGNGSAAPFEILPAVWLTSISALLCGVLAAKLLERFWQRGCLK